MQVEENAADHLRGPALAVEPSRARQPIALLGLRFPQDHTSIWQSHRCLHTCGVDVLAARQRDRRSLHLAFRDLAEALSAAPVHNQQETMSRFLFFKIN